MRPPSFHRQAATIILGVALVAAPAVAQSIDWQVVPSPTEDDLHLVSFVEAQGWIVSHATGQVLHSKDGGDSWQLLSEIGEGYVEDIYFLDARQGWIVGDQGRILTTTDGGATWTTTSRKATHVFTGVHFFDVSNGWVLGLDTDGWQTVILESKNGGATWEALESPELPFPINAFSYSPSGTGWAFGRGHIASTSDRGQTWTLHEFEDVVFRGVAFRADKALFVGHQGQHRWFDNGEWRTPPKFTSNRLRSAVLLADDRAVVAGDANEEPGSLWITADGGLTWQASGASPPDIHQILLVEGRLLGIGKQGTIIKGTW